MDVSWGEFDVAVMDQELNRGLCLDGLLGFSRVYGILWFLFARGWLGGHMIDE